MTNSVSGGKFPFVNNLRGSVFQAIRKIPFNSQTIQWVALAALSAAVATYLFRNEAVPTPPVSGEILPLENPTSRSARIERDTREVISSIEKGEFGNDVTNENYNLIDLSGLFYLAINEIRKSKDYLEFCKEVFYLSDPPTEEWYNHIKNADSNQVSQILKIDTDISSSLFNRSVDQTPLTSEEQLQVKSVFWECSEEGRTASESYSGMGASDLEEAFNILLKNDFYRTSMEERSIRIRKLGMIIRSPEFRNISESKKNVFLRQAIEKELLPVISALLQTVSPTDRSMLRSILLLSSSNLYEDALLRVLNHRWGLIEPDSLLENFENLALPRIYVEKKPATELTRCELLKKIVDHDSFRFQTNQFKRTFFQNAIACQPYSHPKAPKEPVHQCLIELQKQSK